VVKQKQDLENRTKVMKKQQRLDKIPDWDIFFANAKAAYLAEHPGAFDHNAQGMTLFIRATAKSYGVLMQKRIAEKAKKKCKHKAAAPPLEQEDELVLFLNQLHEQPHNQAESPAESADSTEKEKEKEKEKEHEEREEPSMEEQREGARASFAHAQSFGEIMEGGLAGLLRERFSL